MPTIPPKPLNQFYLPVLSSFTVQWTASHFLIIPGTFTFLPLNF